MDIRPTVRAALLAAPAVNSLVDDRIYPIEAPQGERRALIVINRISETEDTVLKGGSGLLQSRIQVDSWAERPDTASAAAEAVRLRLHGLSGSWLGIVLCGCFAGTIRENKDEETLCYRVGRDFTIWSRLAG